MGELCLYADNRIDLLADISGKIEDLNDQDKSMVINLMGVELLRLRSDVFNLEQQLSDLKIIPCTVPF